MLFSCRSTTLLFIACAALAGCGTPNVTLTGEDYEPRIVVEGLLFPGQPVSRIHISRDFRVDTDLRTAPSIILGDAVVAIVDESTSARFPLSYHSSDQGFFENYYEYPGDDLTIRPGGTYTLEVSASVEGRNLFTRATTTVPELGFHIVSLNRESLGYRERDDDGEVIDVEVTIERSPGTTFYLLTAVPLDASQSTFVYDNPFTDEKVDRVDLFDFDYEFEWIQNTPAGAGRSTMDLFWWDMWFYGRHQIIIYAADENYASFIQTFEEVEEEDGNFHEPVFNFEGDGMGYFGSAIADTVFVEITR